MLDYLKFLFKNSASDLVIEHPIIDHKYKVVLIHGANQSSKSFSYIKSKLPAWDFIDINYSSHDHFQQNLQKMIQQLESAGPVFIVGHSLGGVYAAHLTQYVHTVGGVTLSAPYGGSGVADWARYLVPGFALLRDIGRRSKPITDLQNIEIQVPWLQVVSVVGNVPWINEDNDGVLTLKSMRAMPGIEYTEVSTNHYEIMCDDTVVDIIQNRYYNTY
jgi:pimeloyl-ACP methyl ester carboxylesterase